MYSRKMRTVSMRIALGAALFTAGPFGQMVRAEQAPGGGAGSDVTSGPVAGPAYVNHRNVLLIIADDVGVDKIEPYIYYHNTTTAGTDDNIDVTIGGVNMTPLTPTITKLKESGVMFVNAWAYPTCSPTRASLLTGTHPFRHGVYRPEDSNEFSNGNPTTIAQVLSDAGYASGLFGKWHLGDDSDQGPVDHGWEIHEGFLGGGVTDYYKWRKCTADMPGESGLDCVNLADLDANYAPTVNYEDARDWINSKNDSDRWMATVAFNAAHTVDSGWAASVPPTTPTVCGSALAASPTDDEVFRATIECMDARIGQLLDEIDATKLANTTIIFMGDNGTEAARSDTHRPYGHAKDTIYEGGVNVPLIIADGYRYLVNNGQQATANNLTGRVVSPNRISTALVQAVDLFATIADIANADGSCGVDAMSLIPLLEQTALKVRSACFTEYEYEDALSGDRILVRAVRDLLYKLIVEPGVPDKLYKLSNDRWEKFELLTTGGTTVGEQRFVDSLTTRMEEILLMPDCTP